MAPNNDDNPVVVFTSGNYMEAQFVASVLHGSDVPAFVVDDNACRLYPQAALLIGGAKVLVPSHDVERAVEVLQGVDMGETPLTGRFLSIPLSEPAAVITMIRNWFRKKQNQD